MYNIIEVLDETKIWPSKRAYNVRVEFNGVESTIRVSKELVDLILHIQKLRETAKLYVDETELKELWNHIEEYGDAKWSEGCDDAEYGRDI